MTTTARLAFAASLSLLLVACTTGGGGENDIDPVDPADNPGDGSDAPGDPTGDEPGSTPDDTPDGVPPGDPPPEPSNCTVAATFPDLGTASGGAAVTIPQDDANPGGPQFLQVIVNLNSDPERDAIVLQLWDGLGAFAGGFRTGTFSLTGVEADLRTCGTCVFMGGDIAADTGTARQLYVAEAGTLNISALNPTPNTGRLAAALSNVTLREIRVENDAIVDVPGGCKTTLGGLNFDLPVVEQ